MAADSKSKVLMALEIILPALLCTGTFGVDALILEEPGNHTVPVGANVTFHCTAQVGVESSVYWRINNRPFNVQQNITWLTQEGIIVDEEYDSTTSTRNLTMSINAMPQHNNTIVVCVARSPTDGKHYSSYPGKLTVIGPPSPPDPQLHMFNSTTLQLFWLPPFTWTDFPIVNYSIQVRNKTTREVMMNRTKNAISTSVSVETFTYGTLPGVVLQRCEELVFTVYAASNIGQSEPGEVHGGFPIDPVSSYIWPMVTFQSDGTPLLQLRIQLPNVCHFQDPNYTIVIKTIQPSHDTITGDIVIGPKTVRGQTEVHEVVNSSLVVNAVYSALVDIHTVTGNVSSNTTFRTRFQPETEYTDTTATSGAGIEIAVGVSTGTLLTLTCGMLLILCACVIQQRKAEGKSAEKACKAMVTNPIYEGPLYETIQPEFCTLASPGPTTDFMESRYLDKHIHPAMPNEASENGTTIVGVGTLSEGKGEENKNREDCSLELHSVHIPGATPSSEDNYTVMSPVGTLSHSLQGGWGIPEHSNPEEPNKTGFE